MQSVPGEDVSNQAMQLPQLDVRRLGTALRKSAVWAVLLMVLSLAAAWVYLHFQPPVYQSSAVVKLSYESEAQTLGLGANVQMQRMDLIDGELELLRSKSFVERLSKLPELEVTYGTLGDVSRLASSLGVGFSEFFGRGPIEVQVLGDTAALWDRQFVVSPDGDGGYLLLLGGTEMGQATFGASLELLGQQVVISKTRFFDSRPSGQDLTFQYHSPEAREAYLSQRLTAQVNNLRAATLSIAFVERNRQKAQFVVDKAVQEYLAFSKGLKNQSNSQKIEFLDNQLAATEQRLRNFEAYFENFVITEKTTDVDAELASVITAMSELDSSLAVLRTKRRQWESYKQQLQLGKLGGLSQLTTEPELATLANEALELRRTLQSLKLRYTDATQVVQSKQDEVDLALDRLAFTVDQEVERLAEMESQERARRRRLETNFFSLPSKGTDYSRTQRFYELYEEFYMSLIKKKNELEIAIAGTTTDLVVLSKASLPGDPISPVPSEAYSVAVAIGLALSALIFVLSYLLNNKLLNADELERLSRQPILGSVPDLGRKLVEGNALVVDKHPKSFVTESFRSIRANMRFLNGQTNPAVAISSSTSGEGKTFLSINLAGIMAVSDKKVVVVDADMRRPRIHSALGVESPDKGLSTMLGGFHTPKEVVSKTSLDNMDVIYAGPVPPNPAELLLSDKFDELLAYLRANYNYVIFDTPPVGLVTDGLAVLRKVDIRIMTFRAQLSKSSFVADMDKLVQRNQLDNCGYVINSVPNRSSTYGTYGSGTDYFQEVPRNRLRKVLPL